MFTFKLRKSLNITLEKTRIPEFLDVFLNERYSRPFRNALIKNPEPVIVDIGAGEGFFSLYALHRFPRARVFGFEQASGPFLTLQQHWSSYNHSSFSIYNYRVCKNDGLFVESQGYHKTLFVKSVKLNTLRRKYQLKQIDLLKLSCAGNEYEILYHLPAQEFLTIIQIAMDVYNIDRGAKNLNNMKAFLEENGYFVTCEKTAVVKNKSVIWASRIEKAGTRIIKQTRNADQHF